MIAKWSNTKLENICEIEIGGTPSRGVPSYWDGNYCWVSISDLNKLKNSIVTHSKEKITQEGINASNVKPVNVGTVLLSFKLSLGKVAFAGVPLFTNEAIASLPIKDKNKFDNHYLLYALQSINWKEFGQKAVKGNCLNKEILKEIYIKHPPIAEQKRIAAICAKADRLRRTRRYALELSDTYLRSVFLEMFGEYL
jgi:type I restriction enzyme S subunit